MWFAAGAFVLLSYALFKRYIKKSAVTGKLLGRVPATFSRLLVSAAFLLLMVVFGFITYKYMQDQLLFVFLCGFFLVCAIYCSLPHKLYENGMVYMNIWNTMPSNYITWSEVDSYKRVNDNRIEFSICYAGYEYIAVKLDHPKKMRSDIDSILRPRIKYFA